MSASNAQELWLPPAVAADIGRPSTPAADKQIILPRQTGVRRANPQREYAARAGNVFWKGIRESLSRLPRPVDDLDIIMGCDTIRRMMQDPQLNSSIFLVAMACLSRGIRVKPRITDPKDPRYDAAVRYQEFIEYNLAQLETSFTEVLQDMIVAALSYGNCVAEQTWKLREGGKWDGKLLLGSIKPKPPEVYAFVVDAYGNTPGIACWNPDKNPGTTGTGVDTNTSVVYGWSQLAPGWEAIPIEKFAVLINRRKFGDPRGQSALRPAYHPWYLLQKLWPEYLKYLTQFASPSIVATTGEKDFPTVNPETNELEDPIDVLYEELLDFANGTVLALRYGSEVDLKWSQGDGTAFINAINLFNHQMVKAILHQLLATEESKHQARAASSTHQDILNIAVRGLKNMVVSMVHRQIFKPLIRFNFGDTAAELLTPFCSLGDIAQEDKASMTSAYSSVGYQLGPSQWPAIDAELELEVRSADEARKDYEANQKASQAAPGTKPGNPGSKGGSPGNNKNSKPKQGARPADNRPNKNPDSGAPRKASFSERFMSAFSNLRMVDFDDEEAQEEAQDETTTDSAAT